jgi:Na+-translocating ferredoxin:NAD+ oxidoreductase RnfC subunit
MNKGFIDIVKDAGIVGAGGAGFPTHIKVSAKAEFVIVNAAECEPLIRVDQELLLKYAKELLQGLQEIIGETGAEKGYIAIKEKHTKVIEELRRQLPQYDGIELSLMKDFYPAGDEQIMVYEVVNRVVPEGGIPLNVGCVVCNVETVLNVYRASQGEVVTSTYVTITGEVENPATYLLPIGISYREALKLCGSVNLENKAIIDGGPMMGNVISDFDLPITKTTKAIIVLDSEQYVITKKTMDLEQILKQSKTACIQCMRCTDSCPRDLIGHSVSPHKVMRIANYGISDLTGMKTALACSECGACELYSCPNGLSPRRVNSVIKQELAKSGIKLDSSEYEYKASSLYKYRRIPVKRLIERLELKKYDVPAPLSDYSHDFNKVEMLLKQHVGAPATSIVEKGMNVDKGTLIARIDDGKLGANIHASIAGTITEVSENKITIEAAMGVEL